MTELQTVHSVLKFSLRTGSLKEGGGGGKNLLKDSEKGFGGTSSALHSMQCETLKTEQKV